MVNKLDAKFYFPYHSFPSPPYLLCLISSEQWAMGKVPLAGWERGHLTVSSQWAASPYKSPLKSVNWSMKAYQRAVAAVLWFDQRAACMGQRGVQVCACLDTVWMSNPVRQGGLEGKGVFGRWGIKPHERWRASKKCAKLYSFSMKGWIKGDQEGGGRGKKLDTYMQQLEKMQVSTVSGYVSDAAV